MAKVAPLLPHQVSRLTPPSIVLQDMDEEPGEVGAQDRWVSYKCNSKTVMKVMIVSHLWEV